MANCCTASLSISAAPLFMACSVCGSRSRQVGTITVKSLVRHLPFEMPRAQYYFCGSRVCPMVYFSSKSDAPVFRRDDLLVGRPTDNVSI